MLSDHVDQETLIEKSFSYANAHIRNNGSIPNRTELARKERTKALEEELARSKQNVIKHVMHSRSVERSIVQAQLADQALQMTLEMSLGLHNGRYTKYVAMIASRKFDFSLNEHGIYTIELAAGLQPAGLGRILYELLSTFAQSSFAEKLESIAIDPSRVTFEFFYKVCNASSHGSIRSFEAQRLFDRAAIVTTALLSRGNTKSGLGNDDTERSEDEMRWKVLKGLLKSRLLLLKMVMTVFQSPEYRLHASATPSIQLRTHTAAASMTSLLSLDTSSSVHTSRSDKQLLISPGRLRHKDLLSTSLERSRAKQADIKAKISNTILSMYGTDIMPADALRKNKSALEKFRKVGAEKIFNGVAKLHAHFLRSVLSVWRSATEVVRVEGMCDAFRRRLAAYRMLQVLEFSTARSIYGALQTLKAFVARQQEAEYHGAVQQLQRCWRGSLSRHRVKTQQRNGAATAVQSMMRVYLARKATRELMRIKVQRAYVRKIETIWKNHVWLRTMKKVAQLRRAIRKALIIQRIYRGYRGRQRYATLDLLRKKGRNATKFQSAWRRYRAIVRVEAIRLDRRCGASAVVIQKTFRGFVKRVAFLALRLIHRKAKVIQYLALRRKAYKEMMRRKRLKCAKLIQRVARGHLGRKRFARVKKNALSAYEAYWGAVRTVAPIILGYATRRRWAPRVEAHLVRRRAAANVLQRHFRAILLGRKARQRVRQMRKAAMLRHRQSLAAVVIQRRQRGISGRKRAAEQQKKMALLREQLGRLPFYYRMKEEYYRTQNMYHRSKVVTIQCAIRCRLARDRVWRQRRDKKARIIQRMVLRKLHMNEALAQVEEIKQQRAYRLLVIANANLKLVLFVRRRKVEIAVKRRAQVKIIQEFLFEANLVHKLQAARNNFRIQTSRKFMETQAATKIQAVVRGKQAKEYVTKSRRRLERQRQARRVERRQKAAVKLQCCARIYIARRKARRRRELRDEEERERREFEELEQSLEGLHEDFMNELLVIRAQKGARSMLARSNFIKRVEDAKVAREKQIATAKYDAAKHIQAMVRGVVYRARFKRNLPQLRRAQKIRSFCCECESVRAVRRCRQCKDKFCQACYDRIHAKGNRRTHGWEHIKTDIRAINTPNRTTRSRGGAGVGAGGLDEETMATGKGGARGGRRQDWQEFYDEQARAKYWFNKVTGEASWTQPE